MTLNALKSKCMLGNTPYVSRTYTIRSEDEKKLLKFIAGCIYENDYETVWDSYAYDLIVSILIYDELYIRISEVPSLTKIFDLETIITLLTNGILKIVNDQGFEPVFFLEENDKAAIGCLTSDIEDRYTSRLKDIAKNEKIKQLLYHVSQNCVNVDDRDVFQKIKSEFHHDIENPSISQLIGIDVVDKKEVLFKDILKAMRLSYMNQQMIYGATIGATDVILETGSKGLLGAKISPYITSQKTGEPLEVFSNILGLKKVPNLGELFMKQIITIEDILEIRENFNGEIFRKWFNSINYNYEETMAELLGNYRERKFKKVVRWLIPKVIGISYPIIGVGASAVDSFVLDKILRGWSPNLFLNDVLANSIDKAIEYDSKKSNYNKIKEVFPNITANDKCPCGSGRKFKKCCGKPQYAL